MCVSPCELLATSLSRCAGGAAAILANKRREEALRGPDNLPLLPVRMLMRLFSHRTPRTRAPETKDLLCADISNLRHCEEKKLFLFFKKKNKTNLICFFPLPSHRLSSLFSSPLSFLHCTLFHLFVIICYLASCFHSSNFFLHFLYHFLHRYV